MNRSAFHIGQQPLDAGGLRLRAHDAAGQALAAATLRARVGLQLPRHWYHVGQVVHAAPELQLFRAQRTLLLGNDLTGSAELCDFEPLGAGASTAAWAALAEHAVALVMAAPAQWGPRLIAELPGRLDAAGQSPFWQGLTRHFYRGDRADTAARLGPDWRTHLAALLPRQLVYASFLPEAAQAAIGAHAEAAQASHEGLHAAGLRWQGHIRIDDGGPVLEISLAG